jgi:hypothetical protein
MCVVISSEHNPIHSDEGEELHTNNAVPVACALNKISIHALLGVMQGRVSQSNKAAYGVCPAKLIGARTSEQSYFHYVKRCTQIDIPCAVVSVCRMRNTQLSVTLVLLASPYTYLVHSNSSASKDSACHCVKPCV